MSDPRRELFIDQVSLPDDTDDIERRRCLILELFFSRYFFCSSKEESDLDGEGDRGAIATNYFADLSATNLNASTADLEIGANTEG